MVKDRSAGGGGDAAANRDPMRRRERMRENFFVFDFSLDESDIAALDALSR